MILFNYYYYFGLILIVYINYLSAIPCHECSGMVFNYSITIDNIPPPSGNNCKIVIAKTSCSVRIGWYESGTSEVHYTTDLDLPSDSISTQILRRVTTWSAEYATRRFIIYTCQSSNSTPCNTDESAQRAIASTTFPIDEQVQKFDTLIAPTTEFFGYSCFQSSNTTDCPETILGSCQQCWGIMEYPEHISICAMCPAGKALTNFVEYTSTFLLNNQTRLDTIKLGCRQFGSCNSIENLSKIRNTITTQFDFDQFNGLTTSTTTSVESTTSTASLLQLSMVGLFIMFLLDLYVRNFI